MSLYRDASGIKAMVIVAISEEPLVWEPWLDGPAQESCLNFPCVGLTSF